MPGAVVYPSRGRCSRGRGDASGARVSSPRVASMIPLRTSTGIASDVSVAVKPRPSLIVAGRPKRIWSRSIMRTRSRGVIRITGISIHSPSMSFFSVA